MRRRHKKGHSRGLRRRYGRAYVAGIRAVNRRRLGEKLLHWHSSGSDPIYAVGSFYIDDRPYPDKGVVENALTALNALEPRARAGEAGWTRRDATELRNIVGGLRFYLKHDY